MSQLGDLRGSVAGSASSMSPGARTNDNIVSPAEAKVCTRRRSGPTVDEVKVPSQEHNSVDIDDAWCCPICLSWFDMPVVTPCGHSFCGGCIQSVVRAAHRQHHARTQGRRGEPVRPLCPICREVFAPGSLAPNAKLFEEMISAKVVCRNEDCAVQLCPLRWKSHQSKCPAEAVDCTYGGVGCDWKGPRRDLPDHLETCAYEKVKGLMPRFSDSMKHAHTKIHALEARMAARNGTLASMRAVIVGMQHKERRAVFPVVYAFLWRPRNWRLYSCPPLESVLLNATPICLAPIAFLALRGTGSIGGGVSAPSLEQTVVCVIGSATLGFLALVENDNTAPWHELQEPLLLKGLRIGPTLIEISTGFVLHAAIEGLPWWKRLAVVLFLLAPLTYPILMHGLHRLQVRIRRAHDEAHRAHLQRHRQPPPAERVKEIPLKVHGPVATGIFRAAAMLVFGRNVVLAGQLLNRVVVCIVSSVLGPEAHNAQLMRWREMIAGGVPVEEKEYIRQLHRKYFRAMDAPFPRATDVKARSCIAGASFCLFVTTVYASRRVLDTIGYSLMALTFMDTAFLKWEILVGQWVIASLEQTTSRRNQDTNASGNASLNLLRSRALVAWVMIGSMFFVLTLMTP
ncbi:unnamed protein product [Ascophyllum nodosum]